MGAHAVEGEQLVFGDGTDDLAFADAVASADFRIVVHGEDGILGAVPRIAESETAEQQAVAAVRDIHLVAHKLEVPSGVHRIAEEDSAFDTVALENELFINAASGVLENKSFGPLATLKITRRKQVDAGNLKAGGGPRALVAGMPHQRQLIGAGLGLLE